MFLKYNTVLVSLNMIMGMYWCAQYNSNRVHIDSPSILFQNYLSYHLIVLNVHCELQILKVYIKKTLYFQII